MMKKKIKLGHLTKVVRNGGAHPIYEILHIENRVVCCIETYFIPI